MKKGTVGKKVGPLKVLDGIHADGAPLQLNVLVSSESTMAVWAGLHTYLSVLGLHGRCKHARL
eukprot:1138391-Pelagomonas_calceolata.AAC.1